MRRADFCRREESSLNREAQSLKVSPNALGTAGREHAADVLDEDEPRTGLNDDAPGRTPQVTLVFLGKSFAGKGVRLARDAANDAVHAAAKLSAWEGSHIAPHRRCSHEALAHRFDQVSDGEGFPLQEHDRASAWDCQFESEVEAAATCAEADVIGSAPGT